MQKALILLCALGLGGCVTAEEELAQRQAAAKALNAKHDAVCQSFGAQPGTPAYTDCRMRFLEMMSADIASRRQARAIGSSGTSVTINQQAPASPPFVMQPIGR